MQPGDIVFIGYPHAVHWEQPGADGEAKGKTAINQLLWGDYAKIRAVAGDWVELRCRRRNGWVRRDQVQRERLLEINFVDVGQGDGAHIQTPDDKILLVDAGQEDNMFRFLNWRFGRFKTPVTFESMVITHPDKDHYYGFRDLFEHSNVRVGSVFHNGIIEQVLDGKSSLGATGKPPGASKTLLLGVVETLQALKAITDDAARVGDRLFPKMMKTAVDSGRVGDIAMLKASRDFGAPAYMPGFAPGDNRGMVIKVLGPLPEDTGALALPRFGSTGKTKNGNSVVLQIEIGTVRIQLGGDLNTECQDYLLEAYTGMPHPPHSAEQETQIVTAARRYFEADVTKACHHGSPHVAPAFLKAVNPLVTVVSSGDNEPHAHPRPDTLGLIGRTGRGEMPYIFSTELARSTKETIKKPRAAREALRAALRKNEPVLEDPNATAAQKAKAEKAIDEALRVIERSVARYGMINLRTDGDRLLMAQKLERDRSKSVRWDIYLFETDQHGVLRPKDKAH